MVLLCCMGLNVCCVMLIIWILEHGYALMLCLFNGGFWLFLLLVVCWFSCLVVLLFVLVYLFGSASSVCWLKCLFV